MKIINKRKRKNIKVGLSTKKQWNYKQGTYLWGLILGLEDSGNRVGSSEVQSKTAWET